MTAKKKKPNAIVIDFDDVIYDFIPYLCELYNKIKGTCITEHDVKEWEFDGLKVEGADGSVATGEELRDVMNEFSDHGLYTLAPLVRDSNFNIWTLNLNKLFGLGIAEIGAVRIKHNKLIFTALLAYLKAKLSSSTQQINKIIIDNKRITADKKLITTNPICKLSK